MGQPINPVPPGGALAPPGAPTPSALIHTRANEVLFAQDGVQPPSPLYITRDDRLFISARNSVAGVTLLVRGRLMLASGEVVIQQWALVPTSDRALSFIIVEMAEGYLLNLVAFPSVSTARRGQCFTQLVLIRGGATNVEATAQLAAGYAVTGSALIWPYGTNSNPTDGGGVMRAILGTDPAAGAEVVETVPTGARWRLLAFVAQIIASAAPATREPRLIIDDGVTSAFLAAVSNALLANGIVQLSATLGVNPQQFTVSNVTDVLPLPEMPMLLPGWRILTSTINLQAGDNWGAPNLYVEEWIEP